MIEHSFDLAPHAPRHSPSSWLALAIAGLLALFSGLSASVALRDWQEANDIAQRSRAEARQRRTGEAERARGGSSIEAARKAGLQLETRLSLPWSGIFAALEAAGRDSGGEAVLMTMSTAAQWTAGPQIGLNCIASSPSAMLKYVRALRMQVGAGGVRLVSQEKSTAAGPDGVSFQLSVTWAAP